MMTSGSQQDRAAWMATLAKATVPQLEQGVAQLGNLPPYDFLRAPEMGLAMVRGRAEGTGQPFNVGEMTLTRCVVQVTVAEDDPIAGFGYVAGRSARHAELAALCDALLQHPQWQEQVRATVLAPIQAAAAQQRSARAAETEATRVNFFTLLRGEG